jgi:hypothetical protein
VNNVIWTLGDSKKNGRNSKLESFEFLGFVRPTWAFSKGYGESKYKNFVPCPRPANTPIAYVFIALTGLRKTIAQILIFSKLLFSAILGRWSAIGGELQQIEIETRRQLAACCLIKSCQLPRQHCG